MTILRPGLVLVAFLSSLYYAQKTNAVEYDMPPPYQSGSQTRPWFSSFHAWIEDQKAKGNPIAQSYSGGNAKEAKQFVESYAAEVQKLNASQAAQSQAQSQAASKAAEEAEKIAAEEKIRAEEAVIARGLAEQLHREEEAKRLAAEHEAVEQQRLREKAVAAAQRAEVEKEAAARKAQDAMAAEAQERAAHAATQEYAKKQKEKRKAAEVEAKAHGQRADASASAAAQVAELARAAGADENALKGLLEMATKPADPTTVVNLSDLEGAIKEIHAERPSLALMLQSFQAMLIEIKQNKDIAEKVKKDVELFQEALAKALSFFEDKSKDFADGLQNALDEIEKVYDLAKRYKSNLASEYDSFRVISKARDKSAAKFQERVEAVLFEGFVDALSRSEGKDDLQVSLAAAESLGKHLKNLEDEGVYPAPLLQKGEKIIDDAKKALEEAMKERDKALYDKCQPKLIDVRERLKSLDAGGLDTVSLPERILLFEDPVVFLFLNNPLNYLPVITLERFEEGLGYLSNYNLQALFVYLYDILNHYSTLTTQFIEKAEKPTTVKEGDVRRLIAKIKERLKNDSRPKAYRPNPIVKKELNDFFANLEKLKDGKILRERLVGRAKSPYDTLEKKDQRSNKSLITCLQS
jgi:hypothetical protein